MAPNAEESAREAMEASRKEVMKFEEEINTIKTALKSFPPSSGANADDPSQHNHLELSVQKISDSTPPESTYAVHITSPIEERAIIKVWDPLDPQGVGSVAFFEQVETANAQLTIEVFQMVGGEKKKVGVSATHDLLPLCQIDPLAKDQEVVSELSFAIVAGDEEPSVLGKDEQISKKDSDDNDDVDGEEVVPTETEKEVANLDIPTDIMEQAAFDLHLPVCTLTVRVSYTPSVNDKRDALYDKLNEVAKGKAAAIDALRKNAAAVSRAKAAAAADAPAPPAEKKTTVVKSGFLNKPKAEGGGEGGGDAPKAVEKPGFLKRMYEKTFGATALLWTAGPVAKNYIVFIGIAVFFHFKGDLLALPPPV